jgi:hypothetical protein
MTTSPAKPDRRTRDITDVVSGDVDKTGVRRMHDWAVGYGNRCRATGEQAVAAGAEAHQHAGPRLSGSLRQSRARLPLYPAGHSSSGTNLNG